MDDFGKDVGKSWRLSRLIPAYRATLLLFFSECAAIRLQKIKKEYKP
jgi:hypothetical protein